MSVQQEMERFITQEFAFLESEYGFRPPKVRKEGWITWLDFIKDEIAIEVELDWREFDVFLLIVRLEAGKLPRGYYLVNGKKCRVHLLNLIKEKWPVDQAIVSRIGSKAKVDSRRRHLDDLKAKVINYRNLLSLHLNRILAEGEGVFL